MAIKVDIRADISQLRNAVNEANGEITQLKVNGSTFTVNGKQVKAEVKEIKEETKLLKREVQKTSATTQQATAQATRGLKAVSTQAKQAVGFVKSIAQSLITPWTLLIIAVEAAAKTFQYFWNNLTENIDKAVARGQGAIKTAQREIKKTEQRTKAINELIKKLEDLNKVQNLSDDQKAYGISIVNRLNKAYGIFGITLDDVTGKFEGLYQVQMQIDALQRKQQAKGLRDQAYGQRTKINALMKEVFGSGLELGKPINGKDLFTWAERMGGTFGASNYEVLQRKWGKGTDLKEIREVFEMLRDGLSDRSNVADIQKVIDAIDDLIGYNEENGKLNSISQAAMDSAKRLADAFDDQRKAIKATREEVEKLNKQYEQNENQNKFNALTPEKQVEALKKQIETLEERNKVIEQSQSKNQKKLESSTAFTKERDRMVKDNYARQTQLLDQVNARKEENKQILIEAKRNINAAKNKTGEIGRNSFDNRFWDNFEKDPQAAIKIANAAYHDAVQGLSVHDYDNRDKLAATKMKQFADQYTKIMSEANEKIANNDALNKAAEEQSKRLKSIVGQQELDAKAYGDILVQTEQEIASLDKQKAENELKLQGLVKQRGELEKKIAEAKAKAEQDALNAAIENNRLIIQQQMNAEETLAGIAEKAQIEMLKAQGKKAEADAKERQSIVKSLTKQIEGQLGRPLGEKDQALRESIEAGADIQMALKGINTQKPSLQNDQVFSNELARMGGFSSSIVVDRMDISKEILNANKQANNSLNTIANSVQKIYDNTTL